METMLPNLLKNRLNGTLCFFKSLNGATVVDVSLQVSTKLSELVSVITTGSILRALGAITSVLLRAAAFVLALLTSKALGKIQQRLPPFTQISLCERLENQEHSNFSFFYWLRDGGRGVCVRPRYRPARPSPAKQEVLGEALRCYLRLSWVRPLESASVKKSV